MLGAAQFLMVLDSSVMNVSISQLVADFDTSVASIQAVITFYALVMAALMITGGKLGDLWGRRRTFGIGMAVYACGSALTAISWSVPVLALGWSVIEGVGAALVMPALMALIAGNYEGRERATAYGVMGGIAGAGVAVGPILGGWVTTYLTWRLVFVGEVVIAIAILVCLKVVDEVPHDGPKEKLDVVGAVLSAAGLGLVVFAMLRSSVWGWIDPKNAPFEPFGFAPTVFLIAAGLLVLAGFARWQRHREGVGSDPLVRLDRLRIPPLRSGLSMLLAQNLILMGVFFAIPLYLQVVQGYNAFETGLRMLPVSIMLFIAAMSGPVLARRFSPRSIVRGGLGVLFVATIGLLAVLEPSIVTTQFLIVMGVLGAGLGLLSSQLGNVVQSAVGADARSEVGGLQNTAMQLGGAIGTALIGSIVIGGLATSLSASVMVDDRVSEPVKQQVGIALDSGISFVTTEQAAAALADADVPVDESAVIVDHYADAQLRALKTGLLLAALITLLSFAFTAHLPADPLGGPEDDVGPDPETAAAGGPDPEPASPGDPWPRRPGGT